MDCNNFDGWETSALIECNRWLTPVDPYQTREEWLVAAIDRLATSVFPTFTRPAWRVTCGWPKGIRGGKHAIGQCWDKASSNDGTYELFISPELDHPFFLLETLAHEMVHAIVGCEEKHKGPFPQLCKTIGLEKPWTATKAGPELAAKLAIIAHQLGPYPHSRLNDGHKKQTTRLLKATCPNPDCEVMAQNESGKPYTVRITQQWAELGCPTCPCGTQMKLEGQEETEELQAA